MLILLLLFLWLIIGTSLLILLSIFITLSGAIGTVLISSSAYDFSQQCSHFLEHPDSAITKRRV